MLGDWTASYIWLVVKEAMIELRVRAFLSSTVEELARKLQSMSSDWTQKGFKI
jgi:hypothetical protein